MDPLKVLGEFIDEGFEALIKARADLFDETELDEKWTGTSLRR